MVDASELSSQSPGGLGDDERPVSRQSMRTAVVASAVGTLVEWYDFGLYGAAAALVIGKLFFPSASDSAGILASFATFAVGYFARPLGGVIIGHIGDRRGRRAGLVWAVVLMGISTVAIGALPTYGSVGAWAPALLVILRLVQGLGAGAEFAGAVTLLSESTPRKRHGVYTSVPFATAAGGVLLATLTFYGASKLPGDVLLSWGWRLPFLFSVVIFAVALVVRYRLQEPPEYLDSLKKRQVKESLPLREVFGSWRRTKIVLLGFFALSGFNVNSYVLNTFAISYLTSTVGLSSSRALLIVICASLAAVVACPLFGMLSDRLGYRRVFVGGAAFIAITAFPFFFLIRGGHFGLILVAVVLGYSVGYGAMSGSQGAFLIRLFPTRFRFSGVAVAREANGAFIAGPTPLVAGALVGAAGGEPWLVAGLLLIAEIVTITTVLATRRYVAESADQVSPTPTASLKSG